MLECTPDGLVLEWSISVIESAGLERLLKVAGRLASPSLWKIPRFRHSLTSGIHASEVEGGMTVSGPPKSRMTRPLGADEFSW